MRRAAKRDKAEADIVRVLKVRGWIVEQINAEDAPDLLLSKHGRVVVAEVKTGTKSLRPGQKQWLERWQGEWVVLRTVEDALNL